MSHLRLKCTKFDSQRLFVCIRWNLTVDKNAEKLHSPCVFTPLATPLPKLSQAGVKLSFTSGLTGI